MVMKRKIYNKLLNWKKESNGEYALLIDGARRVGKSYIVRQFAEKANFDKFFNEHQIFYHEQIKIAKTGSYSLI